jgi:class 3 adenylate cyclase
MRTGKSVTRRLAVILAADVADYSRLMAADIDSSDWTQGNHYCRRRFRRMDGDGAK